MWICLRIASCVYFISAQYVFWAWVLRSKSRAAWRMFTSKRCNLAARKLKSRMSRREAVIPFQILHIAFAHITQKNRKTL